MLLEDIKILQTAIKNEIEGYEFYRLAAESTDNKENKRIFNMLADEERKHENYLRDLAIKLGGEDEGVLLDLTGFEATDPDIYDWDRFDDNQVQRAMTIFNVARGLEEDSIKFYEDAAKRAQSEDAKKLFKILIAWERVHYNQFDAQYKYYRNEFLRMQELTAF